MYQEQRLIFYYAVSPVHMGAGSATGAIDNPIQREIHTNHPVLSGSGIKGAVRHHCEAAWGTGAIGDVNAIFGPGTEASAAGSRGGSPAQSRADHAGAVSFTDAQLVAFPVRSMKECFVYATSPATLARLKRMAGDAANWNVPLVNAGEFLGSRSSHLTLDNKLILESFEFTRAEGDVEPVSFWLSQHALPADGQQEYFSAKLKTDLIVLNDTDFSHFVDHSTVVEPHVRINNESGTAESGGLFYTENLPPETLLAGRVLCTVERSNAPASGDARQAKELLRILLNGDRGINDKLLQAGGDATTGRGLLVLHAPFANREQGA
jgi:CRISPR-associated protein Cmr4